MSLTRYRDMRHFDETPEPSAGKSAGSAPMFVVQLHHASHRHYDFRLEHDGVLKSWAVPKGPSFDPAVKRLAMQVEDHPLDYATFEGVIPAGNYGAGDVLIFDHGTWSLVAGSTPDSVGKQLGKGHLRFTLQGDKLRGAWDLIRTGTEGEKPRWILRKAPDDEAGPFESDDLLGDPAEQRKPTAVWISNRKKEGTPKPAATGTKRRPATAPAPEPKLTSGDRVVYPEKGISKAEVFEYYRAVAPFLLPEIAGRPLAVVRSPAGAAGKAFFQKHLTPGFGAAVHGSARGSKDDPYVWVDDLAGVLGLAQMNVLELHAWGGRVDDLEHADRIVIDLDPAEDVPWKRVLQAAELVRDTLARAGLTSFARVTGGKGVHVVAPLAPRATWDVAKGFTHELALALTRTAPDDFIDVMTKAKRRGKIFVDYLRNGRGATAVASYSLRNKAAATVAMPVSWDELRKLPGADAFDLRTALKHLARRKRDPWEGIDDLRQALPRIR